MSISKNDCMKMLTGQGLSQSEAKEMVDELVRKRDVFSADGKLARGAADLAEAINGEYDEAARVLALRRKQAAINILRRNDLDAYSGSVREAGFSLLDALEAKMVGSAKRLPGARQSADARRAAIFKQWAGQFLNALEEIGARHGGGQNMVLRLMAKDPAFKTNFARERIQPGSTSDKVAREVAELYGKLSEEMRTRLNDAGADIGHLEGRLPQSHDAEKLLRLGKTAWLQEIEGWLDMERSFPERTPGEVRGILSDIYDTIATGRDLTTFDQGLPVTPKNLASGLGRKRTLHFKDADAYLAYQERYGRGNLFDAIFGEMEWNSRKLGLMEVFGPNPEIMIRSLLDAEAQRIRAGVKAGSIDADAGQKQIKQLDNAFSKGIMAAGKVARWLAVLTGETQQVSSVGLAKAGGIARSVQSLSKLGAAALSAMSDGLTKGAAMRVNGAGFLERMTRPITDYFVRYEGDKRVLARELGFMVDSYIGSVLHRFDMADSMQGKTSSLMHTFFKASGLNFVTEQAKTGNAMWLSSFLGRAQGRTFADLDPSMRAMLEYHGFGPQHWEIFRKHMVEGVADGRYFNPALARNLSDAVVEDLMPERLQGDTPRKGYTQEQWDSARARQRDRIRTDLETQARAFFIDETMFAVIEPDAKTTAAMTRGTRRGTAEGELIRSVMQFKSFPIAFWQRIMNGKRWQRGGLDKFDYAGVMEYVAASLVYGYIAMSLKDIAKNRTPKDPRKVGTWFAAMTQSGGAGIYGDFFLGKANRFGNDFLETLAGPLMGEMSDVVSMGQDLLHGEFESARDQLIRTTQGNLPFINLWYTKAALDWMFLDTIKEWMSPGYKRRMLRNMQEEYGQRQLIDF